MESRGKKASVSLEVSRAVSAWRQNPLLPNLCLELEAPKKPVSGEKLGSESDRWNIRFS